MLLSRKWLNEFVPVDVDDRTFAEDMTCLLYTSPSPRDS